MRRARLFPLLALAALMPSAPSAHAATQGDFAAAFKAAQAAEQQADQLRNRWTPTEQALKAAQKAAAAQDYDKAVVLANRAEALAKASIAQVQEQDRLWRSAVVH